MAGVSSTSFIGVLYNIDYFEVNYRYYYIMHDRYSIVGNFWMHVSLSQLVLSLIITDKNLTIPPIESFARCSAQFK